MNWNADKLQVPNERRGFPLVGQILSHYRISDGIGAGGMGAVYRATDLKLGREVAVKVLPAEMASDAERRQRFQREARVLASLDHPGIVGIYSVEEANGVHFLTMPLVEGAPLDHCIPAGGLGIDRLFEIASALAAALTAAHDKGIVHRDLKPANVMITGNASVKILDFGLAKVTSRAGEAVDPGLSTGLQTLEGTLMGTMPYMSPEQVQGSAVDHRTDIFSFGVMLYEMATGRRPFHGRSVAELASAILRDAPPSASSVRPDLPAPLQRVIESCLQKSPSARPQTAQEMHSGLTAPPGIDAITASPHTLTGDRPSIAVLPLASLSPDPNDEYFADGVTEEILNALAQIPGLRVVGRGSSFSLKGKNEDLREVGNKLRVATLLEGTLRRAGNRLRVTAQLIDARSGYQLWSERYDRVIEDVFAVQDEIAVSIAGRLRLTFAADREGMLTPPTRHLGAYELYLKGRVLLYQRGLSIPKALACFTEAVALDPGYAQAWAGLADGYTTSGYSGFKPGVEVMPRALEAARRSLELDPNLAEAHNALACATLLYEREYAMADQEFRRALQLNPMYPQARAWYGLFFLLLVAGREPECREQIGLLLDMDPLSAYAHVILAFVDCASRRFSEAVRHARRGVELDPESYLGQWILTVSLLHGGQRLEAYRAVERALAMSKRHSWALSSLVTIFAALGEPEKARTAFTELMERGATEYVQPCMLAPAAAAVGEGDLAISFAERALHERDPLFVMMPRAFPIYDQLRGDPRFLAIARRLELPEETVSAQASWSSLISSAATGKAG